MWPVVLAHIQNWMPQARRFLDLIQLRERFLLRLGRPPVKLPCTLLPRVLFSNISCNHASQNDIDLL
jgi:hypothetical protein